MRKLFRTLLALALLATPSLASAQTSRASVYSTTLTISTSGSDCSTATNCAIFPVTGVPSIGINLLIGVSGTFNFEATTDTGTTKNWFSIKDDVNAASSATGSGQFFFTNSGYSYVRIRASAISGAATAIAIPGFTGIRSTATLNGSISGNPAASATGSAVPTDAGYTGVNIGGTLTGWTGLTEGSVNAGAVIPVNTSGSPNAFAAPLFVNGSNSSTGTMAASNATVVLATTGLASVSFALHNMAGANADTVTFKCSVDGTNYFIPGAWSTSTATADGVTMLPVGGCVDVEEVMTTYASGTVTGNIVGVLSGGSSGGSGGSVPTGTAGSPNAAVVSVQGVSGGTALPTSIADGSNVTQGAKADAKSTATDTTAISIMQVMKEISFMEQTPASRAVTNAGTFATQAAQSGTWNVTNISGTVSLPTGAATSANQTNASQKTQIVDGSGNVIASTSNNLDVQCANCSGTGASATDNASVTEGTSTFAPIGGEFQTTPGTVTTGHQSMAAITAHRALQVSFFDPTGAQLLPSAAALSDALSNPTTTEIGTDNLIWDSTNSVWRRWQATAGTGHALVDIGNGGATATNAASGVTSEAEIMPDAALTVNGTLQSSATANGNGTALTITGEASAVLTVNCSGCSGGTTVTFKGSEDGTNYTAINAIQLGTTTVTSSTTTSGVTIWKVGVSDLTKLEAVISSYSAGTITVTAHASIDTVEPIAVQLNGTQTCYLTSGASNNSTNCKTTPGSIYAIHVTNTTTTSYYLRLYDAASAPTCSSSTGFIETIPALGAPSAAGNGAINGRSTPTGQQFVNGIGFCLTGGGSSTDNTNAATGVYITILYK